MPGWAGGPLPTTYGTKTGLVPPGIPQVPYLSVVLGIFFQVQPVATVLAGSGAVVLVRRLGTRRDSGLLPLAWTVALPLAYGALSAHTSSPLVGNFGRYFFPLFPLVVLLAAVGIEPLWDAVPARLALGRLKLHWPLWIGALLLLPTLAATVLGAGRYGQSVVNVEDSDVRMARLLQEVLPPQATLAVNDIGALKFLLPNRIIDLAGIATPEVQQWVRRAIAESGDYHLGISGFLQRTRPDYLVVFPTWFSGMLQHGGVPSAAAHRGAEQHHDGWGRGGRSTPPPGRAILCATPPAR